MEVGSVYFEESKLVTYDLDAKEPVIDGLAEVFDAIGYDLSEKEPPLIDYINLHAVDNLQEKHSDYCLITSIWQHPVSITPEKITVYESGDGRTPG